MIKRRSGLQIRAGTRADILGLGSRSLFFYLYYIVPSRPRYHSSLTFIFSKSKYIRRVLRGKRLTPIPIYLASSRSSAIR